MSMMQKPKVMSAVMDLQQHPENMTKYMNDPEVMQFMMKMNELTLQVQNQGVANQTPPPGAPSMQQTQPSVPESAATSGASETERASASQTESASG